MPRKPKAEPPKPRTRDDQFCDQVRTACAKAMAKWVRETINAKRPICSLSLAELECMAEAATSAWIVEMSNRAPCPVDEAELQVLLMGG